MCYDISTGLFDTNMKRLYMCDKPGRLCRLPHKSCTADCILFAKENVFVRLLSWPLAGWPAGGHMCSSIKFKHIDV